MQTAISAKKRKSTNLTLIFRSNHSAIAELKQDPRKLFTFDFFFNASKERKKTRLKIEIRQFVKLGNIERLMAGVNKRYGVFHM